MCNVYKQKVPTTEGYQFDGTNGEEIIEWLGGPDYGVVSGETLILSLQGKDPRSTKVTVNRGQFVVTSKAGTSVVNEGEFIVEFANEDGSDIVSLPPPPPPEPLAEDELVYQPGFAPLTEEDKKKKAEEDKKRAEKKVADDKKRAEDKAAADKKKAADDKKSEHHVVEHHR
jgi:type IV secretory pathway VirB10-like protein